MNTRNVPRTIFVSGLLVFVCKIFLVITNRVCMRIYLAICDFKWTAKKSHDITIIEQGFKLTVPVYYYLNAIPVPTINYMNSNPEDVLSKV